MKYVLVLLLTLCGMPAALACSCGGSAPFLTMASRADLVVLGTVQAHEAHGVDLRVDAIYRGSDDREVIRAWGDDGASCRPYTRTYPVGLQIVLALKASSAYNDDEKGGVGYAIDGCGEMALPVSNGTVYIGSRQARVQLSRLEADIAMLDQTLLSATPQERRNLSGLVESGIVPGLATEPPPVIETVCNFRLRNPVDGLSVATYESISAGLFDPPLGSDASLGRTYSGLPAICRVTGYFVPTRDTVMPFEMWLPSQDWNGGAEGRIFEPSLGLGGAVDTTLLNRGTGVFGLALPATGIIDISNPVAKFREVVERLETSNQPTSRAFLGTTGVRSGGTALHSMQILPRGPGRMEGRVTVNDQPVAGLRLRLMLNALLWSPWVSTDSDGVYFFDLPYGTYSIDGYSIDSDSAEQLLSGTMDQARQPTRKDSVVVSASGAGRGLDLEYVEPIVVQWPAGDVTVGEARQIVWNRYPGASHYWIWIGRRDRAYRIDGLKTAWSAHDVQGTSIGVPSNEIGLGPGEYEIRMTAYDSNDEEIVSTRIYASHKFRIVE